MFEDSKVELLHKRPTSITTICILTFILLFLFLAGIIILFIAKGHDNFMPILFAIFFVIHLITWLGIWYMKKWAAYMAIAIIGISIVVYSLSTTRKDLIYYVPSVAYYIITLIILLKNIKAMS